jgi:L-threonylcarbamoyladenylate synthase
MLSTYSIIDKAVDALGRGEVVLYPTDTLLGLGARAVDEQGVAKVFRIKDRPLEMPISVLLSSTEEIETWASLTSDARILLRRSLPGPYTFIVWASERAKNAFARGVVSADGTLGVRIPDHPIARELAQRAGPITTTSANIHGKENCRDLAAARRTFGRGVAVYLPATPRPSGHPSTIVDIRGGNSRLVPRK